MASLLRSVFGSKTETEEEKKNEPNTNSNSNPPSQPPPKKPLSKQELADKRLGKLEAAIVSQPATSESIESPPHKKRKTETETEDNAIDDLSEDVSMKLSIKNCDENEVKNEISADIAYEYLAVMCILEIRHNDLSDYNKYSAKVTEFKQLLSNIDKYCIINEDTPISSSTIEAIFIDRFQCEFGIYKSSFKYLLQSYQRCIDFETRINNYWTAIIPQKDQLQIVSNIQTCILTFCQILLSTPDLTTMEDFLKSQQEFQHVLNSHVKGRDFPKGFLIRLFEQIENDSIDDVLDKCMSSIKSISLNVLRSNFSSATNALIKLSQIEKFALYLMDKTKPFWIPRENYLSIAQIKNSKPNAHNIIVESVMGGLLNLSFETPDINGLFNKLTTEDIQNNPQLQKNINSSFSEYRLIVNELQNGIYCVFNNFVRIKNKKCKENVLRLLSYFIYINLDRGKMRFDHTIVSTDGFMLNLNYLLLKLCEPIIKRNLLSKIDVRYFLIKQSRNYMCWQDATRLSADNQQIQLLTDRLYGSGSEQKSEQSATEPSFGFTTEVFCLTLEALHLGFSCVENELHRLKVHIERLRREARANPVAAILINMNIQRLEKRLLAQIAHLMDTRFMLMVGSFYGFFCKYLLYLSTHSNGEQLSSIIPEYFIEDLSRFFQVFLSERAFVALIQRGQSPFNREEVIQCLIYLMSNNTPIKNIYQRACLCEVLLHFLPAKVLQSKRNANIVWNAYEFESHEFNRFESCRKELVSTLLRLYSDVERTGSPGQYYEKFKFRTIISRILKFLFSYKIHQNNLLLFWQKQEEEFIAFLNMLINDLIYTLDHGFDGLTEIRQIENEPQPAPNTWNPMQPQQNEAMQRQENISQLKDTIRHYMNLANESIELLKFVCYQTPEPFMDNLILPRIAVLVSVYLDRLANGSELRVRGNLREDYNFNAKFLLTSVVNIFNKLCSNDETKQLFLDAIVEDEAHFRQLSYNKAINVLRRKNLMNMHDINLFEQTLSILLQKFQEKRNIEFMLGDIPIKYLDPIMQTLMSDPVVLGNKNKKDKNRYVMDRKVIERHLMNNPSNPFNREPLSKNDLIPDIELKNEIDEWVKTTLETHKNKGKDKDNDEQKEQ